MFSKILYVQKVAGRARAEDLKASFDLSSNQDQKQFEKKFASLAARSVLLARFGFKTANL